MKRTVVMFDQPMSNFLHSAQAMCCWQLAHDSVVDTDLVYKSNDLFDL